MTERPTGLILAGGASRRFGSDKRRHLVQGRAMIHRVHDAVAAVAAPVWVSVRDPADRPLGPDVPVVIDAVPGAGPLAGVVAGLQRLEAEWLLVVACDLPLLRADALHALIDAARPGTAAVVARGGDGRPQPLCACYHRAVRDVAEAHLAARRLALHDLLAALDPVRFVRLPDDVLLNVNHPSDTPG